MFVSFVVSITSTTQQPNEHTVVPFQRDHTNIYDYVGFRKFKGKLSYDMKPRWLADKSKHPFVKVMV